MTSAIDASGFRMLAADFDHAGQRLAGEVRAVVVKGAVNIKKTMRDDMRRSKPFQYVAPDIDFDVNEDRDSIEAEVGAVIGRGKGHAGGLAHIAYFGAPKGGGGTVRDPQAALDEEAPGFNAALEALLGGLI